jgi:hypothetical protein
MPCLPLDFHPYTAVLECLVNHACAFRTCSVSHARYLSRAMSPWVLQQFRPRSLQSKDLTLGTRRIFQGTAVSGKVDNKKLRRLKSASTHNQHITPSTTHTNHASLTKKQNHLLIRKLDSLLISNFESISSTIIRIQHFFRLRVSIPFSKQHDLGLPIPTSSSLYTLNISKIISIHSKDIIKFIEVIFSQLPVSCISTLLLLSRTSSHLQNDV